MCLKDANLARYLRWQVSTVNISNSWTAVLPRDANRVGVILPTNSTENVFYNFLQDDNLSSGFYVPKDESGVITLTYGDYGPLVQETLSARATTAGPHAIQVIYAVAPSDVMEVLLRSQSIE